MIWFEQYSTSSALWIYFFTLRIYYPFIFLNIPARYISSFSISIQNQICGSYIFQEGGVVTNNISEKLRLIASFFQTSLYNHYLTRFINFFITWLHTSHAIQRCEDTLAGIRQENHNLTNVVVSLREEKKELLLQMDQQLKTERLLKENGEKLRNEITEWSER